MSFALTTDQVRNRTKTVTRRVGWTFLKPGTLLQPVVKAQGIKKGERIQKIGGPIRVLSVTREPLRALVENLHYGFAEVEREGFADHPAVQGSPDCFVDFYRNSHVASQRLGLYDDVTRIEFEYVEPK